MAENEQDSDLQSDSGEEENEASQEQETAEGETSNETGPEGEDAELEGYEDEEEEEEEFDIEAQIEVFRAQIEEDPENCIHYYNLGEALSEIGDLEAAKMEYENALQYDVDGEYASIIHFGLGELRYHQLIQGISSNVVKSSVGLLAAHKDKATITQVDDDDYKVPLEDYESAIRELPKLKADEEIVEYVSKNAPLQIGNIYYKWASDLLDKARQVEKYGSEIKDAQTALKYLKKTLEIDPNHSAAQLMLKLGKKMLAEGWKSYDEYGFEAKDIPGLG